MRGSRFESYMLQFGYGSSPFRGHYAARELRSHSSPKLNEKYSKLKWKCSPVVPLTAHNVQGLCSNPTPHDFNFEVLSRASHMPPGHVHITCSQMDFSFAMPSACVSHRA
ncbi:hypothetical protein VNO77_08215 [Canavalia gladiata]|uniref:Uncharacterized protein n=1 Tax=Canavalia gladiata TaxID=3824 RepID=A0AAN9M928_CANGL